jgi:hypothetical protein
MEENQITNNNVLVEKINEYEKLMNWFCDRVEKGEVRSYRTYSAFCKALGRKNKFESVD